MDSISEIQTQCMDDSQEWFPNTATDMGFLTVAMAGELGEFANIIKKIARGSLDIPSTETPEGELVLWMLREELTDLFIYVCNTATLLDVDLGKMYDIKRGKNVERFGPAAAEPPAGPTE